MTQQPATFNGNLEPLYPAQPGRTVPPCSTITPEAGYHTYCAPVPSTQQHETEILVYDSDHNHEVGASDPETCKQDFFARSPNFTYEDTERTGTGFKKPQRNPWVDRMKWRPGLAVLLLREVQTHA